MKLIKDNVYYCGVADFGRRIFDQLIPLPNGTTYNSYYIEGSQKRALIDTSYSKTIKEFLDKLNGKGEFIDYVIANHAEGDHSEALVKVLQMNPNAKVVTNKKCMDLLIDQYAIPENWKYKGYTKNRKGLLLDKKHWKYGGHSYLRGITDKKITPLKYWISKITNIKF